MISQRKGHPPTWLQLSDIPSADTNICYKISLSQRLSALDRVVTPPTNLCYNTSLSQRLSASDRVVTPPTNLCYKTSLSQRLSVSDRVVTPPNYWHTPPVLNYSLDEQTASHITSIGDTTHKMSEDLCLEGWPPLQFLLFLDRCVCRPHGDTTHKMSEDRCLEGWPSLQFLLFLDRGDTTNMLPEDCCLEGRPSLQCLHFLDKCVCRLHGIMTCGLSVSDVPSAGTTPLHRITMSQHLSVSDRFVAPSTDWHTPSVHTHHSEELTAYQTIPIGDSTHTMSEDCCLEGWPSLQCLLCLCRCVCHIASVYHMVL